MQPRSPSRHRQPLIAVLVLLAMVAHASAAVTTFAWYRGGEADTNSVHGSTVTAAMTSVGSEQKFMNAR